MANFNTCKQHFKEHLKKEIDSKEILHCKKTEAYKEEFEQQFFYSPMNKYKCPDRNPYISTPCWMFYILMDLVAFKVMNDRFGYSMGDGMLRLFGEMVKNFIRSDEKISKFKKKYGEDINFEFFRHGGDEFSIHTYRENFGACCTNQLVDDDDMKNDMMSIATAIADKWHNMKFQIDYSFTKGIEESNTFKVSEYNITKSATDLNDNQQHIYLRKLKLRVGVGRDIEKAEKAAKDYYPEEERGVINKDCEISILRPINDEDKWYKLKDHLVLVAEKKDNTPCLALKDAISKEYKFLEDITIISHFENGANFFIIPIKFEETNKGIRERLTESPYGNIKLFLSWVNYVTGLKENLVEGLKQSDHHDVKFYSLSGKPLE
uniref:GGDEF domain-containing protein n=1 Tax=uncultured bacterium contig00002 TaxID=1181494 RepID=A0A806KK31_9BACT|nr:hypothetical protein [uncultured bacterium contig00002]